MARMRAPIGMSSPRSPRGIAEPVPALVMAQHELADRRAERHVAQNLGADARVNLDALELLRRQRVGLRQDVFGHRHVADVVQQRRGAHRLHVGVGQPGRLGEHRRVLLNRSHVLRRTARLRFDRERERFDRRQLHFHRTPRLVLLLAQARDHGVVAAEHEIQRQREQREPAEPAA